MSHNLYLIFVIIDIEDFIFEYPDRNFHIVAGNCDYFSTYKSFSKEKNNHHKKYREYNHSKSWFK